MVSIALNGERPSVTLLRIFTDLTVQENSLDKLIIWEQRSLFNTAANGDERRWTEREAVLLEKSIDNRTVVDPKSSVQDITFSFHCRQHAFRRQSLHYDLLSRAASPSHVLYYP